MRSFQINRLCIFKMKKKWLLQLFPVGFLDTILIIINAIILVTIKLQTLAFTNLIPIN